MMQCRGPLITQDSFVKITPQQSACISENGGGTPGRIIQFQWKRAAFTAKVVMAMQVSSARSIQNTTFDAGFLLWKNDCLISLLKLEKDLWTKCFKVKKVGWRLSNNE